MPKDKSGNSRLTDKQEKFVLELIKGKSQREAYRTAYPMNKSSDKTIDEAASRLMKNNKVLARFDELQEKVREPAEQEAIATAQDVLKELTNIGMGKKKFPSYSMFGDKFEREPTVNERLKAIEQLGKYHGIYTDNVNINHSGIVINDDIPAGTAGD